MAFEVMPEHTSLSGEETEGQSHERSQEHAPGGDLDPALGLELCLDRSILTDMHSARGEELEKTPSAQDLTLIIPSDEAIELLDLGQSLLSRFEDQNKLEELDLAIDMLRRADTLMDDGHHRKVELLEVLCQALQRRCECLWKLEDIEYMIAVHRHITELIPGGHSEPPKQLVRFGLSLSSRFKHSERPEDLDRIISVRRFILDLTPVGHPKRPSRLNNLGTSLHSRFEQLGTLQDLEEAIIMKKLALDFTPEGHPAQLLRLGNYATSLHSRFDRLGKLQDLDDAIVADKLTLDLTPEDHPERPERLGNYATSLHSRFDRLGKLQDLDDAIVAMKLVLNLTPEDHPEQSKRLGNYATSLHSRFERLGKLQDLEDAVAAYKLVLDLTPEGHSQRPERLRSYAISLHSRFERLGKLQDLEDTIVAKKLVLDLTPEGHSQRPERLRSYAISLQSRFERLGKLQDLEDAIGAKKRVLDHTPEGHPERPERLASYAISLYSRFIRLGKLEDLEDAIVADKRALDMTPEGHPARVRRLYYSGIFLRTLFKRQQSRVHFHDACNHFMKAAAHRLGDVSDRVKAAQECVSLLSKHPEFSSAEKLLDAHSRIIQLLPEIVWFGHSIDRRFEESAKLGDLVYAAVSACVGSRSMSKYQAIEWMELGRSLIWSQILSLREPLDSLEKMHPKLATELQEVSLALQHPGSASHPLSQELQRITGGVLDETPPLNGIGIAALRADTEEDRHRRLVIRHENIVNEVREQQGFENFLRPPSIASRMPIIQGLDGPIVFINVHSASCDALALFPNGDVRHVLLPQLSRTQARELCSTWTTLLKAINVRTRDCARWDKHAQERYAKRLLSVLQKLWTSTVQPILQGLDFTASPNHGPLSHITWCPTGPLMQLPLHAAGIYDSSPSTKMQHVFDYVVSSYTPSLSTLLRCYESVSAQTVRANVLGISQSATPDYDHLPCTQKEIARIKAVLPESTVTVLNDEDATVKRTIVEMHKNTWVHLACHGYQDPEDPTQSAFALFDGPLTLSTLMSEVAKDAELAFLSACQTAVGDEKVPEESAHLAAGMLAVGFKGVIATMWSIGDADAPIIVEAYYKRLLELRREGAMKNGYTGAAYALHEATKVLREHVGEKNFVKWAPFVHFGV